jgi:FkbM family methyltransferase
MLGIRVRVDVAVGCIGVGCLDAAGSSFIDEAFIDASSGSATVELLAGTRGEAGSLVVRNASADGASVATVLEVQSFDFDEPLVVSRESIWSPRVMPGWCRYYGSRGTDMAEKLRVRRFEQLAAPTTLEWSDGLRLRIAPGDQLSRAVYVSGTYEPNTLRVLRALLEPGDTFLDVGANAGVISLAAARWVGPAGRVVSFEPSQREFARLTDHLALNAATQVTPVRAAVGAREGRLMLRVADASHGGLNTLGDRFAYADVDTARTEMVDVVTLDQVVARERIERVAAIKMDIEGAEGAALSGGLSVLRSHRPALVIEVCARALEANGSSASLLEGLLQDAGYVCFAIDDTTGTLFPLAGLGSIDEQNIVALPTEHAERVKDHVNAL